MVFGDGLHAAREAAFIAHFSPHVTLAGLEEPPESEPQGVQALSAPAAWVDVESTGALRVGLNDGQVHSFDVAYSALQPRPSTIC